MTAKNQSRLKSGKATLMAEGNLQVEGEVIHVIVTQCFDVSKLLRPFTKSDGEQQSLLTVSRSDKKPDPPPPNANKQRQESRQQKTLPRRKKF